MADYPRLSVYITHAADRALRKATELTGYNNTDNVSLALVWWATLQEQVFLPGNELIVRNTRTGELTQFIIGKPEGRSQ